MVNTITVSQLNTYVKSLIENDVRLMSVNVSGEISNFKNHFSSGHWYFTLKDKDASIRCVMFRSSASRVTFNVEDGLAVVLTGRVSIYEKEGQYQFYAEEMRSFGAGDLALAFKQVKEKLEAEGLFSADTKRQLVKFPRRIAVITSDTGAAIKDILNITSKRYPCCEIVVCNALVQGESAASDLISTLDRVYALDNIDTIIIGRGGGSAEDLHCFNNEQLARKIYESPIPVISAVGHETDFTICDFVADVRASTPSHAAELAVPNMLDLNKLLLSLSNQIKSNINYKVTNYDARVKVLNNTVNIKNINQIFEKKQIDIDLIVDKTVKTINYKFQNDVNNVSNLMMRIDALNPLKVISRGFSVISKDQKYLLSIDEINKGDNIDVTLNGGSIDCNVIEVKKNI